MFSTIFFYKIPLLLIHVSSLPLWMWHLVFNFTKIYPLFPVLHIPCHSFFRLCCCFPFILAASSMYFCSPFIYFPILPLSCIIFVSLLELILFYGRIMRGVFFLSIIFSCSACSLISYSVSSCISIAPIHFTSLM